jgi:hypothetical protein
VARGREAAARRADAACSMTSSQDGAADWSIGSGGREEGGTDAHFSGLTHGWAAGDREDQACHRRHREGHAAGEEGGTEGWANERQDCCI